MQLSSSATSAPAVASYGTWKSPISAELLASGTVQLCEVTVDESNEKVYYTEARPAEDGRRCIIEFSTGKTRDILPKQYSAATKVHEYGGAAVAIRPDGHLLFTDSSTMGVFSLDPDTSEVQPLIAADNLLRHADLDAHPQDPDWVLGVREDHREEVVKNCVVAINSRTRQSHIIAEGADFYSHPKFSRNGKKVCWLEWYFPDMPWTGTQLFTADWDNGKVSHVSKIAGKTGTESVSQPRWGIDNSLFFASDRTGYWQLYHLKSNSATPEHIFLEGMEEAEFSKPEWTLGACTYIPLTANTLVAGYTKDAVTKIAIVDIESRTCTTPELPLLDNGDDRIVKVSDSSFVVLGRTEISPQALYLLDLDNNTMATIASTDNTEIPSSLYSTAQHIPFKRVHGEDEGGVAFCLFFPPHNPAFVGPSGELPPLIVSVHGGPTSHSPVGLSLRTQYWTSRGYALVQLNFTGSSGYGRKFRDGLNEKWGLIDIADAASCVSHLVSAGLINPSQVFIRGGSGGGYACLQSLCSYPKIWRAGLSEYGVSELKMLTKDTHKFESRYLQGLLFKDSAGADEKEQIYHDRSPLYHAEKIEAPLLLLQGTEDHVVPPNQAQEMETIIKENGGEVKLIFFVGEGHGSKIGRNIWRAIEEEEAWWVKQLFP